MRIVGGKNKGTRLRVAKRGVRPTKAIVREAIFNIIGDRIPGARVLDVFAGSGALGLEAISRGARHCVFIDNKVSTLKKNITALKYGDKSRILKADYTVGIRRLKAQAFDIIFIDPPYHGGFIEKTMRAVGRYAVLRTGGAIVAECGSNEEIRIPAGFTIDKKRTYGDTTVLFISDREPVQEEHTADAPVSEMIL